MNKKRSWFSAPAVTVVAFIAAIGLLAFAGVGTARAALTVQTNNEIFDVALDAIGVTLQENDKPVANRDHNNRRADGSFSGTVRGELLKDMLNETDGKLVLNNKYTEKLAVTNSGSINEFVRVSIYRYWLDKDDKQTDLSPELIHLSLGGTNLDDDGFTGGNGWIKDTEASTPERIVLYYSSLLNSGSMTPLFADEISIDNKIATAVKQDPITNEDGSQTIITTYKYDGVQFCLEVTVDAVQEHNAQFINDDGDNDGAIKSAWGRNVTISGTSLSLN